MRDARAYPTGAGMEKLKINRYEWSKLDQTRREQLYRRVEAAISPEVMAAVREVLDAVQREGDAALIRYSEKFDKAELQGGTLRVTEEEFHSRRGPPSRFETGHPLRRGECAARA